MTAEPVTAPKRLEHGDFGDPRYPSRRKLRWGLAFLVDWLLHSVALVTWFFTWEWGGSYLYPPSMAPTFDALPPWWGLLLVWVGSSFIDRVLLQWACQGTIGKLIFGLRIVDKNTGGRITFWRLIDYWFHSVWASTIIVLIIPAVFGGGDVPSFDPHYQPKPVRRRDIGKYWTDEAPVAVRRPPALDRVKWVIWPLGAQQARDEWPGRSRILLSWMVDWMVHLPFAAAALIVPLNLASKYPALAPFEAKLPPWWALLLMWVGVSFLHRTVVQWIFTVTLGKAVTGLRAVDAATYGRPAFFDLVTLWVQSWSGPLIVFWLFHVGLLFL